MSDVEENATDDLRSTIEAAINSEVENEVANEPIVNEAIETPTETKASRVRDEKGRFKKIEPETEVSNEGLIADGKPAEPTPSEAVDPVPVDVLNPPQSWTAEAKEQFLSLNNPVLQRELLKRETDYSKGIQRHAEDAKWASEHKQVFEQWQPYLNQLQITPAQAFQSLIQADYNLRYGSPQEKQQLALKLLQDYGISLPQGQEGEFPTTPNPEHDAPVYNQLNMLRQQLANMQYQQQQEQDRIRQEQEAQNQAMIDEFASNPKYPHFEALRESMGKLIEAGMAETLEAAYEQAAWANPEIRSTLQKNEEAKRINEQAELAKKAKLKAVSVTGTPSGTETPASELGLRDQLKAAMQGETSRI